MLLPAEAAAISAADAALAHAEAEAEAAAQKAESAWLTNALSSTASGATTSVRNFADQLHLFVADWRSRRDALIESPDYDHDQVVQLVTEARRYGSVEYVAPAQDTAVVVSTAVGSGVYKTVAQAGAAGEGLLASTKVAAYILPLALLAIGGAWLWSWLPKRRKGRR